MVLGVAMSLYSLKTNTAAAAFGASQFIITKFDDDLNVEGSYLVTSDACTCPAGHRSSCRHRKMLPRMKSHLDDGWFYDYEHQNWHRPLDADAQSGQDQEPILEFAPDPVERAIENAIEVEEQLAVRAEAMVDNPPHIRRR